MICQPRRNDRAIGWNAGLRHSSVKQPPLPNVHGFASQLRCAITLLMEGATFARDTSQDIWQFAVEVNDLLSAGLTKNAVRWLVSRQLARHAVETTSARGKSGRRFRAASNLIFPSPACLVLTEAGIRFARQLEEVLVMEPSVAPATATATTSPPEKRPQWDATARVLWWEGEVVKHFKVPAANQELVLSAFQEEGWPPSIYDPLQPAPGIDAKRRLHDTINRLNRNQRHRRLRFFGNGNGQAICWAPKR